MENYKHKIHYYETDKMGVTHHSNYIRIMEETRVDIMERMGYGYDRMESEGIMSPVMSVSVEYKKPTTYPDVVEVELRVAEISHYKIKFDYNMTVNGVLVCHANSMHCFLDAKTGRPIVMRERFPEMYDKFCEMKIEK